MRTVDKMPDPIHRPSLLGGESSDVKVVKKLIKNKKNLKQVYYWLKIYDCNI
jgi:hypothetical protein